MVPIYCAYYQVDVRSVAIAKLQLFHHTHKCKINPVFKSIYQYKQYNKIIGS